MAGVLADRAVLYPMKVEGGRAWFLLLRRGTAVAGAGQWEAVYADPRNGEGSARAAVRALVEQTQLEPLALWALDRVETGYDAQADAVFLMPCFVALVSGDVHLGPHYDASRWFSSTEAANALTSEQRRSSLDAAHHDIGLVVARGTEPDLRLRVV